MINQIFYYTGGLFLITLSLLLSCWILLIVYYYIKKLAKKINFIAVLGYKYTKMTKNERKLINDLYESFMRGDKQKTDKYFYL